MPKKNTLLFLVLITVSFMLMTYQSKKDYSLTSSFINNLFNNTFMITKTLSDSVKKPFKKMALREEENKKLRKRIDDLLMEREKYQEAIRENKRLKKFLQLSANQKNYVITAKIIARGLDHFTNIIIINKGLKDGVLKDMSAITPKGLTGKIISVSNSHSQLLPITDINFSAAVRLRDSRKEGVVSGTGTRKCILKYISLDEDIQTGNVIITSGLDSFFPPGIPVGYVSKVDSKGTRGHFQYIEVIPFQDSTKLEEVIIIK